MSNPTPNPNEPPQEDYSFGALREEMPDVFADPPVAPVAERDALGEPLSLSDQEKLREKAERDAMLNARVLGESGARSAPMWIKGFLLVGVSAALLWFLVLNPSLKSYSTQTGYLTMFIALGTAAWCGNGVMKDDEPRDRALAAVGALLGLAILLVAFLNTGG